MNTFSPVKGETKMLDPVEALETDKMRELVTKAGFDYTR